MSVIDKAVLNDAFTKYRVTHKRCPAPGCDGGYRESGGWDFFTEAPETEPCETCDAAGFVRLTPDEFENLRLPRDWPTKLTHAEKLMAMSHRFYGNAQWTPKAGDLYTTSRNDLELYEVVKVADGKVWTRYRVPTDGQETSSWPEAEFLSPKTFGYARVHVPRWVFSSSWSA